MNVGISRGLFVGALVATLVLSVVASYGLSLAIGPAGPQGLQGEQGPPGPSIPFAYNYGETSVYTTSTSWVDMPAMSVSITLAQTSHILIMFGGDWIHIWGAPSGDLLVRALVNSTMAYPEGDSICLTTQNDPICSSFIFYLPSVSAGVYTVKIQWRVYSSGYEGCVADRTLNVIALPE